MTKIIISTVSFLLCSTGTFAEDLKYRITEYDVKLINYLINKRILVKTSESTYFKLNQEAGPYSNLMSKIQVEESSNSLNCTGNGGNGL